VVRAHGTRTVAGRVAQLHQEPVTLLTQRIVRDQPLGAANRFGPAPTLLMPAREPLERLEVERREPLPLVHQPLVIAALQQLARVRLDRLLEPPLGQRALEMLESSHNDASARH
jgi:hypothetical protein